MALAFIFLSVKECEVEGLRRSSERCFTDEQARGLGNRGLSKSIQPKVDVVARQRSDSSGRAWKLLEHSWGIHLLRESLRNAATIAELMLHY